MVYDDKSNCYKLNKQTKTQKFHLIYTFHHKNSNILYNKNSLLCV